MESIKAADNSTLEYEIPISYILYLLLAALS